MTRWKNNVKEKTKFKNKKIELKPISQYWKQKQIWMHIEKSV